MSIFEERKVDCHIHVLDPARFPYQADTPYRPMGQEQATASQFFQILDAYGVGNALVVGSNSGYGTDSRCLLDCLARGEGRLKGIAVVPNDIGSAELGALKSAGIVGVAFNATFYGDDYYLGTGDLIQKVADLDLFVQIQAKGDQLVRLLPLVEQSPRVLIDHCGLPDPEAGLDQPGFRAVLALGRRGRAVVKLSGYAKYSREPHPHADAWPYVRALVEAFTLERCLWASDWPFLRAPERVDYGPLLKLVETLFSDERDRAKLLWQTPQRLFGFRHEPLLGAPADSLD
jgi:predicted TIM-barrel fold metal-dependent hydrolase